MNILMVLDNEFTGDLRVENEVMSLSQAGHKIYVLCFNHGTKEAHEDFHGAKIIRIPISLFRKNKMKGFTSTIIDPYTPYWAGKIVPIVKKYDIQALHMHDLYMLGAAFLAQKRLKYPIPIIGDLHENYPEALKHYQFTKKFPGKYLISIKKWEKTEIEWIKKADFAITVIEEAVERYVKLGIAKEKLKVVANYVNEDEFLNVENDPTITSKFKDNYVLTYAGGFDLHRGLESVIKSLPLVKEKIPELKLVLIGDGRTSQQLKELVEKLNVSSMVSFEGWQAPQKLPAYLSISNAGLIPHLKTKHTDNTIPHKLFQYMLLQKPVIATNCDPLVRILNSSRAGLIYESNQEEDLAQQIIRLHQNDEMATEMGINGKKAVIDQYNWNSTAQNLIHLYQQVEKTIN